MLQYKVPQNIRMPDQIIGPLTLEQFLYLLFAAAFIYIAYLYIGYGVYFWVASVPVALVAIAFAFVPVNEQPFSKFIANLVLFLARGKVLTWQQLPPPVFEQMTKTSTDKQKEKEDLLHPQEVKSQLQQLSLILDTQTMPDQNLRQTITDIKQDKAGISTTSSDKSALKKFKSIGSLFSGLFSKKPQVQPPVNEAYQQQQQAKKEAVMNVMNQSYATPTTPPTAPPTNTPQPPQQL